MSDLFGADDPEGQIDTSRRARRGSITSLADLHRNETKTEDFDLRPLAERMRPQDFDDYLGQEALIGPGAPLRKLIESDRIPSMMFWGPPGSGKTSLARIIAQRVHADFVTLSAVTATLKDVRLVVDQAKVNRKFQRRTILFLDEIHRFNKAQQDGFLPHVESGVLTLIGATTENPGFAVIAPLLSRCRVFVLKAMTPENVARLLERGIDRLNSEKREGEVEVSASQETLQTIVSQSDGDARRALGLLELVASVKRSTADTTPITVEEVGAVAQRQLLYDKTGEEHYNLISALQKTIRSSDPHGASYWLGRMLMAGEDPLYIARRLVRMASEDIGLADPFALNQAMECLRAYQLLGSPEGELALYQCATYLAMAPKSNSVYTTASLVREEIGRSGSLPVPLHLRNAPTKLMKELDYGRGYSYDHDAPEHFVAKQGLPDEIARHHFYTPSNQGRERAHRERLAELDAARDEAIRAEKE
jgi:putative ATPase